MVSLATNGYGSTEIALLPLMIRGGVGGHALGS
jgi:hypothetical protein